MNCMSFLKGAVVAAAVTLTGAALNAQNYPDRSVTWVIPFGAGGGTDQLARLFTAEADRIFGQTVSVENRSGAGGVAGWQYILGQPADGYTIFNASPTPIITLVSEEQPPISPNDIAILGYLGNYAAVLIGAPEDYNDWDGFVATSAKSPLTVGGTNSVLLGVANALSQAGVEAVYVSYPSTGEAVTDFLGGHIDLVATTESTAMTIVPEKGVALMNTSSIPLQPEVDEALGGNILMPRDLGYKGIAFPRWVGVHPDTPEDIQIKIAELIHEVAMDPTVQTAFAAAGSPIAYTSREDALKDFPELVELMRKAAGLLQ